MPKSTRDQARRVRRRVQSGVRRLTRSVMDRRTFHKWEDIPEPAVKAMILQAALPSEFHVTYQLMSPGEDVNQGYAVRPTNPKEFETFLALVKSSRATRAETYDAIRHDENLKLIMDLREPMVLRTKPTETIEQLQVPPRLYEGCRHLRIIMPLAIGRSFAPARRFEDSWVWTLTLNIDRAGSGKDAKWSVTSHEAETIMEPAWDDSEIETIYEDGFAITMGVIKSLVDKILGGQLTRWRLEKLLHVLWIKHLPRDEMVPIRKEIFPNSKKKLRNNYRERDSDDDERRERERDNWPDDKHFSSDEDTFSDETDWGDYNDPDDPFWIEHRRRAAEREEKIKQWRNAQHDFEPEDLTLIVNKIARDAAAEGAQPRFRLYDSHRATAVLYEETRSREWWPRHGNDNHEMDPEYAVPVTKQDEEAAAATPIVILRYLNQGEWWRMGYHH